MAESKSSKKNLLLVVSIMSQFPELFRLALKLKNSDQFNPIIYFNLGNFINHSNFKMCLDSNIEIIDYYAGYIQNSKEFLKNKTSNSLFSLKNSIPQKNTTYRYKLKFLIKTKHPKLFHILKEFYYLMNKKINILTFFYRCAAKIKRYKKENELFKRHEISLIVLADDNEDYFTPQLVKMGHKNNIKSIIFPYTFANQFEFLEDAYAHDRRISKNIFNFVIGHVFKKWTYEYKGKKLLRSDPSIILCSEIFRTSPHNPWAMCSGHADHIAVESSFMKEYYRNAGISESKMIETGSVSFDELFYLHSKKNEIKKKIGGLYGLDPDKPWVVCALPPYQKLATWPYKNFDIFLEKYIQFFFQFDGVEVIFKFHPRFEHDEVKRLSEKYGIKFVFEDTLNLIAVSEIYLASVSSTMRWSLALGLPTINFDVYNYNYGDFDKADKYFVVHRLEEFKVIFKSLYVELFESHQKQTTKIQPYYGKFDGKSFDRIIELFQQSIECRHD